MRARVRLIIGDNVVRNGEVTNPMTTDASVQGVRTFIEDDGRRTAADGHRHANGGRQRLGWLYHRRG